MIGALWNRTPALGLLYSQGSALWRTWVGCLRASFALISSYREKCCPIATDPGCKSPLSTLGLTQGWRLCTAEHAEAAETLQQSLRALRALR
jgi:hypothetical protein